jgi:uncharacterized coiled-coil protein SlyX
MLVCGNGCGSGDSNSILNSIENAIKVVAAANVVINLMLANKAKKAAVKLARQNTAKKLGEKAASNLRKMAGDIQSMIHYLDTCDNLGCELSIFGTFGSIGIAFGLPEIGASLAGAFIAIVAVVGLQVAAHQFQGQLQALENLLKSEASSFDKQKLDRTSLENQKSFLQKQLDNYNSAVTGAFDAITRPENVLLMRTVGLRIRDRASQVIDNQEFLIDPPPYLSWALD